VFLRKILKELDIWTQKAGRKPLILRGARQTGKTTAIHEFSKNFSNYLYFNLENIEEKNLLEKELPFDDYVSSLFLYKNVSKAAEKTLVFIDEIQNSPNAVKQLRYFYEKRPDLHVVAAGSLLETLLEKHISFPVGRVEYLYLYPFNFEEFVWALSETEAGDLLRNVPAPEYAHEKMLSLFHKYTLIGGMPEAVRVYVETGGDIIEVNKIYSFLMTSFLEDVEKYADSEKSARIIRHVINSAAYEAGKRIKYQGFGNSNYHSREISEALSILEKAMLIRLIRPVTATTIPAVPDMRKSPRLQFLDTGFLNHLNGLQQSVISTNDLNAIYKGILTEHIATQEVISLNTFIQSPVNFWVREKKQSNARIDLILQHGGYLMPVEIKSGKQGTLRSLHQFISRSSHPFAVRIYNGVLRIDDAVTPEGTKYKLLNLPYYCMGNIERYLDWFIKSG
jgi:predicted AAA+ superfamily ATPase